MSYRQLWDIGREGLSMQGPEGLGKLHRISGAVCMEVEAFIYLPR